MFYYDICFCATENCKRKSCFRHKSKSDKIFEKNKDMNLVFAYFDETTPLCPKHKKYLKRLRNE